MDIYKNIDILVTFSREKKDCLIFVPHAIDIHAKIYIYCEIYFIKRLFSNQNFIYLSPLLCLFLVNVPLCMRTNKKTPGNRPINVIRFDKRTVTLKRVTDTLIPVAASACVNELRRPPHPLLLPSRKMKSTNQPRWFPVNEKRRATLMPFLLSYAI